jgi:hypothetical protein
LNHKRLSRSRQNHQITWVQKSCKKRVVQILSAA